MNLPLAKEGVSDYLPGMNSSSSPSSSSNSGDPWEELAEDLFGLEYGKEHGAREPSPPKVSETPAPRTPESVAKVDRAPEPAAEAEAPAFASPTPDVVEPEIADSEYVQSTDSDPAPAPATGTGSAQDSYWDALANWNWDDSDGSSSKSRGEAPRSSGGPPGRGGSRGRDDRRERRGEDRPQRQSGGSAPPAPRPAAPPAGDDFGLGLEGESEVDFSAPVEPAPVAERHERAAPREQAPSQVAGAPGPRSDAATDRGGSRSGSGERTGSSEKSEDGEFPRKRRRRRRRRSRGGERETPGTPAPASAVPGGDWDDSAGPEADTPDDESMPAAEEAREEPARAGGGDRPPSRPNGRNRGRRHEEGPRSRAPEQSENRVEADAEEPEDEVLLGGGEVAEGGDDDSDESGEPFVSYEDVPTWEEAISYLLHPSTVQVEGGSSSGSSPPRTTPPADQPRQTRHVGHRKHRR